MDIKEKLIKEIHDSVFGDPWHGPSIQKIFEDIAEEEAYSKPFEYVHNILELTLHMWAWTEEVKNRIEGKEPSEPEMGDWPDIKEYQNESWYSIKNKLFDSTEKLIESIKKFPGNKFSEMAGNFRDAPLGTGTTYEAMIMGLVQHNAYHGGQVSMLMKYMKR